MISIDNKESIAEATRSFEETLLSLSNDAAIIRQLSSLQIATGITATTTATPTTTATATANSNSNHGIMNNTNSENRDPNLSSTNKSKIHQTEINKSMIQQLNGIHTILTQLESKVSTISHVLQEEQSAIQALQQTKSSALAQYKIIKEIRQNLEDQELNDLLPGNGLLKMKQSMDTLGLCKHKQKNVPRNDAGARSGVNTSTGTNIGTRTGMQSRNAPPQAKPVHANASANANTESHGTMSNARTPSSRTKKHNSRKYTTPQQKSKSTMPEIHLRPITPSEFQSVSKNIRRRITLSALNEALSDIQKVTLNKYHHLCHSHFSSRKGNVNTVNANAHSNSNVILNALHKDMVGGDDLPFISEQEIRDDCAFFRTGESTARAILQILRSCKRIKQIFLSGVSAAAAGMDAVGVSSSVALNGNGALVTYVWLNGSD